jgi:hypothetical protein
MSPNYERLVKGRVAQLYGDVLKYTPGSAAHSERGTAAA